MEKDRDLKLAMKFVKLATTIPHLPPSIDLVANLQVRYSIRFQIYSHDIADKLSIALISHARNAARYALQWMERVHASGISLGFRNGGVFLSNMTLVNVRVHPSILPLRPYNLNRDTRHVFHLS